MPLFSINNWKKWLLSFYAKYTFFFFISSITAINLKFSLSIVRGTAGLCRRHGYVLVVTVIGFYTSNKSKEYVALA
jgi:hypothetical protein